MLQQGRVYKTINLQSSLSFLRETIVAPFITEQIAFVKEMVIKYIVGAHKYIF